MHTHTYTLNEHQKHNQLLFVRTHIHTTRHSGASERANLQTLVYCTRHRLHTYPRLSPFLAVPPSPTHILGAATHTQGEGGHTAHGTQEINLTFDSETQNTYFE